MLAGVVGFDAAVGGVEGFEPEAEGPLDIGDEDPTAGKLAPLPAAPDPTEVIGVLEVVFEFVLGFVTTVAAPGPSSDPHAHRPSRLSAITDLDAPRKYMIFLRMPWQSIRPIMGLHNAGMSLCVGSFTDEPGGSLFGANR